MKRVVLMILDSLGIGAMPDAGHYGDEGANTLAHIAQSMPGFAIPNLIHLGLGMIDGVSCLFKTENPMGSYGRGQELSVGKDTITGHWEIGGIQTQIPFKTYENGFPKEFIKAFEERIGVGTLGNYPASGTEIIKELGEEHIKSGKVIVYTSADSVFQIAAHEEVVPLSRLYEICLIAREMLVDDLQVGRVIARPFIGKDGNYTRTSNRKDYAVSPPNQTLLDHIKNQGKRVCGIGKIGDIFNMQGISDSIHTENNMDGVDQTIAVLKEDFSGLIFTNLVDFDAKFGHRRDAMGYGKAMEEFDLRLPELLGALQEDDCLILCADHGNDPIHQGWDHTREYIPVLFYGKSLKQGVNLGTLTSFADIGATIGEFLGVKPLTLGESKVPQLISLETEATK